MRTTPTSWRGAILVGIIGACMATHSHAVDPSRSLSQYNCRTWRRDNGLPSNSVTAIACGQDGRLWLGTSQGPFEFDGVEFQPPKGDEGSELRTRLVTALIPRKAGGYWFGLDNGGYGIFDGKTGRTLPFPTWARTELSVRSLTETRDGRIIMTSTSSAGIGTEEAGLAPLFKENWIDAFSAHEAPDGRIWIGTAELGLFYHENGRTLPFADTSLKGLIIHTIATDPAGNLWLATPQGLRGYNSKGERLNLPATPSLRTLFVDSHGVLWLGTIGSGVMRYANGKLSNLIRPQGLGSNDVLAIAESKDGSLWIGTSDGLTQLSDLKFPTLSSADGLVNDGALWVTGAHDGSLWIGTSNGISRYKDGAFSNYGTNGANGLTSVWVKRIFVSRNGDAYLFGSHKNIDRFSAGKVVQTWITDIWARDMEEDSQGRLYVAVGRKLMQLVDGKLETCKLADGNDVEPGWINDMLITEDDTLWMATEDGVFELKDGVMTDWCKANNFPGIRYHFLTKDDTGNLWAAQNHGIVRFKDGKMRMITREQGLRDNYVYAIVPDNQGNFWMDSNRGIFRTSQAGLNAAADGKTNHIDCAAYDGADAVKSSDKVALEYSGTRTQDGRIWFPTAKGVVMIDPARIPTDASPPIVSISQIRINGRPFSPGEPIAIDPGPGNLEFDYAATEYIAPQKVQYRYRLIGFEANWVQAGPRRSAFYTNIAPGHYRFEVQASLTGGGWAGEPTGISLVLPQRLYETLSFRITGALFLLGIGYYLYWMRKVHRKQVELKKANLLMEEKVRERTAELRAEIEERKRAQEETERLHDELRATATLAQAAAKAKSHFLANMSHEIRTPMNAVIGMTNLLLDTPLGNEQRELAETARNSAEALLTILNDILDFSKMEAGKLTFEKLAFDLRDAVEESLELLAVRAAEKQLLLAQFVAHDLPEQVLGDPTRLRQVILNLVGNAIKFTSSGEIIVHLKPDPEADRPNHIRFEIQDTGMGIDSETQRELFRPFIQADSSTTRRFGGTGLGLAISQQIVSLMGGTIGVESEPGKGSLFWFSVPLERPEAKPKPFETATKETAGKRVLHLCQNRTMAENVSHHAEGTGITLTTAADCAEADRLQTQAAASQNPYHAVIVQQARPGTINGEPHRLVAWAERSGLPVILLTALPGTPPAVATPPALVIPVPMPLRRRRLRRALLIATGSSKGMKPAADLSGPAAATTTSPFGGLRILVAEDNKVNQRVIQLQLEKAGYTARIVSTGKEVLKAVEEMDYNLIIMDCQMPELDGYETTRRLRQSRSKRDIHIIAMTANALAGDREQCLAAGMNDYLSKPTKEADLLAALRRAISEINALQTGSKT